MRKLFRSRILHCLGDPSLDAAAVEYIEDGILVVEDGKIVDLLPTAMAQDLGLAIEQAVHMPNKLMVPGFIDTHVHAPQMDVIASYGAQLLDWLERFTFPSEMRFAEPEFAELAMQEFVDLLLASGTTTAMTFSSSHEQATGALFNAAADRNMCFIAGKVLMDRNAPAALLDSPESGYQASKRLIEKWHQSGRLAYAVTPRFSITSTPEQLSKAGQLMHETSGLYLQTHLSENAEEIAAVKELFPKASSYLDTYDSYGLCTDRSFFAHGIHLEEAELDTLKSTGSSVAFCPSSNLFLGSGLFDWRRLDAAGVPVSLASDVGGGLGLSMLNTLSDAYKVCQLRSLSLEPMKAFYSITLGNARSLGLEQSIGNLSPGSDADFLILDPSTHEPLDRRLQTCNSISEEWFAYMMLGDERVVSETWIAGEKQFTRGQSQGVTNTQLRSAV